MPVLNSKPLITVVDNTQKGKFKFSDILTSDILSDLCCRLTGQHSYDVSFIESDRGYNKGRLATVQYNDTKTFVSFSEHGKVAGRNYFFQSLTTAFTSYLSDESQNKRIVFYFLPTISGSFESDYFRFMYRLMATNGVEFINADSFLEIPVKGFVSLDDIVTHRNMIRGHNVSNSSTYITCTDKHSAQIYGKTYGASKKEAILLCHAAARLSRQVDVYEICEQDLSTLPAPDKAVIKKHLENVSFFRTNKTLERAEFERDVNYRSPTFIYNLFQRYQSKECAFCHCQIAEIIAGAHIWPVAEIKRNMQLSADEKLSCAVDGNNGLWLCHNHHKMFDENLVTITNKGRIVINSELNGIYKSFIKKTTTKDKIPPQVFNDSFFRYLHLRTQSMSAM